MPRDATVDLLPPPPPRLPRSHVALVTLIVVVWGRLNNTHTHTTPIMIPLGLPLAYIYIVCVGWRFDNSAKYNVAT